MNQICASDLERFHYFHPVDIRYEDIDAQRHVNNVRYFSYMEQARVCYLQHLGLWQGHDFDDIGVILAEQRCRYFTPITYDQKIRVGVRIARLGKKSMDTEYLMCEQEGQHVLALGEAILVAYSYNQASSITIPDTWRTTISMFEGIE